MKWYFFPKIFFTTYYAVFVKYESYDIDDVLKLLHVVLRLKQG